MVGYFHSSKFIFNSNNIGNLFEFPMTRYFCIFILDENNLICIDPKLRGSFIFFFLFAVIELNVDKKKNETNFLNG